MPHRYQATLDLAKAVIHKLPAVFPQARHQEMESTIVAFERDPNAPIAAIEEKLIAYGAEIWPYAEAYEAFYKIYGEAKERQLMRTKLSATAAASLDKFVADGGNIEAVRTGDQFEHFANADIRAEVIAAEMDAHDVVHGQMEALLAGDKQAEFAALLKKYQETIGAVMAKINDLEKLASRSEKWAPEILDKVKIFKEGFAYVERAPSADDVSREIQYYVDIIEI